MRLVYIGTWTWEFKLNSQRLQRVTDEVHTNPSSPLRGHAVARDTKPSPCGDRIPRHRSW